MNAPPVAARWVALFSFTLLSPVRADDPKILNQPYQTQVAALTAELIELYPPNNNFYVVVSNKLTSVLGTLQAISPQLASSLPLEVDGDLESVLRNPIKANRLKIFFDQY